MESSAAQGYSVHGDNQGRTDLQAATLDLMADDQVLLAALPPPWAAWLPGPLLQGVRAAAATVLVSAPWSRVCWVCSCCPEQQERVQMAPRRHCQSLLLLMTS